MKKEVEYLGYLCCSDGLRTQPKKIEAIVRVLPAMDVKQLKRFLGMITFYRDVFERRSHIMAPLTDLAADCGKRKGKKAKSAWKWEKIHQDAFDECKQMLAQEAKLAFPDFSLPFHLYTDASDRQLGATLVQNGKPLGFYTRKLNSAQLNYSVGEKELLGLVEGVKAFEGMIRGFDVTLHTDHLNLLYNKLPNQRMSRWRLLLEEFHPKVVHISGEANTAADGLSRLEMKRKKWEETEWEEPKPRLRYSDYDDNEADGKKEDIMMTMTKVLTEQGADENDFDDVLLPVSTRSLSEFNNTYPLSIKRMRDDQLADA